MTIEETVLKAKKNIDKYAPRVWQDVYKVIYLLANRFYNLKKERCISMGVDIEDLKQQGYFAMLKAINSYSSDKPFKFSTYLNYATLNEFNELTGLRTQRGKKDILATYVSIDTPVNGTEDLLVGDTLKDDQASEAFERAEDDIFYSQVHKDISKAMERLTLAQQQIIELEYYEGLKIKQIADLIKCTENETRREKSKALGSLRRSVEILKYKELYIYDRAYRGTGLSSFKENWASSVEVLILDMERRKLIDI